MGDDSIYRDYYWAADQLSTDTAIRVYVLLGAAIVLGLSILAAFWTKWQLEKISADTFVVTRKGRPPKKEKSIEDAKQNLRKVRAKLWKRYGVYILIFTLCGFVIPSAGLYLGAIYYDWFDPTTKPFVSFADGQTIDAPTFTQVFWFVLNQLSHGALLDYPEVFRVDVGAITNNPNSLPFSILVVIYRSIVSAFALVFPLFVAHATMVAFRIPSAKKLYPNPAD